MQDRKYLIDAAVVRTMKARRTVTHTDLVTEVVRLVRFPLDIPVLKQRIEQLMESEYMKRDEKEFSLYHYIAWDIKQYVFKGNELKMQTVLVWVIQIINFLKTLLVYLILRLINKKRMLNLLMIIKEFWN